MKISIDIDCSPAEARQFFGLPDLEPLHAEMTEQMKSRMIKSLELMDPEMLLKTWFPAGSQGMEQFRSFMQRMMQGAGGSGGETGGGSSRTE